MKLRIVVATDDGETIFPGHPGDGKKFIVYELKRSGEWKPVRELDNEARDMEEKNVHGSSAKMKRVLNLIGDVDIVLSRRNSPNLMRMAKETTIQPVLVMNVEKISDGIEKIVENFDDLEEIVSRRKEGDRFEVMKLA